MESDTENKSNGSIHSPKSNSTLDVKSGSEERVEPESNNANKVTTDANEDNMDFETDSSHSNDVNSLKSDKKEVNNSDNETNHENNNLPSKTEETNKSDETEPNPETLEVKNKDDAKDDDMDVDKELEDSEETDKKSTKATEDMEVSSSDQISNVETANEKQDGHETEKSDVKQDGEAKAKSDVDSNATNAKDVISSTSEDNFEKNESSSPKEKSFSIDAIAQKLGRQVQGEGSSESKSEEKKKSSSKDETKSKSGEKESKSEKKKKKKGPCEECGATKGLKYQVLFQGKIRYMCSETCFKAFKEKQKAAKAKAPPTPDPGPKKSGDGHESCAQCKKDLKDGKGYFPMVGDTRPLCSEDCLINYQEYNIPKKVCAQCKQTIEDDINCLSWETMEFCNEDCLGKYQSFLGSHCTCCQSPVQQTSLGKYCVCFGADIRQFCSGGCLEEFKKGLKVCSFCQKDLSTNCDGFLAPVGDKGQFKDFCTQSCMERYETMNSKNLDASVKPECSFCLKPGITKIQAKHGDKTVMLCNDTCVAGYRFTQKIMLKICDTCYKFFEPEKEGEDFHLQFEGVNKYYCTKACMTLFVLSHRKIVPCSWCKVKKYNFDMIEKMDSSHQMQTYCSLNCISLFRVSLSATSAKSIRCDNCSKSLPAKYHLTMSDGSIRNFCTYPCVVQFQNQFTNSPTLTTSTTTNRTNSAPAPAAPAKTTTAGTPVISNVISLAGGPRPPNVSLASKLMPQKVITATSRPTPPALTIITTKAQTPAQTVTTSSLSTLTSTASGSQIIREVIVKPPPPKSVKNKAVLCKPIMQTKAISCKPHPCHKAVQTDDGPIPTIIPIPIPIYIPTPVHMFSRPVPCPVPFPVPIPVPIFVPLTKDSPAKVMKQLKDIQEKIPSNPFEAELLMMAEMVAEDDDKKEGGSNDTVAASDGEATKSKNLKICDLDVSDELDVEAAFPTGIASVYQKESESISETEEYLPKEERSLGKRTATRGRGRGKRSRVEVVSVEDANSFSAVSLLDEPNSTHKSETSDTTLRLKYAFGVNAWKHWVLQKNTQLEKGSQTSRKFKPFKTDLLQLPPDELNYSLCLFVKEVRKPTGEEYAPASIYYLSLGIQQYLFENGRIDNIFTDPYYEKFTECLNDVLLGQVELMSTEGYYISRIEEEVLWESKQLGAHSPHVLLNTLMFFNTKFFNLKSIDDHAHLSFSHIAKHWRKTSIKSGPRNVILRYFPPPNKEWDRRRKDENAVYEQTENVENPLRCPVKLYEFYMSKCPESVKTRNDVFYLYPERSCVPDSPVWYSTQALNRDMIAKMLQRIKTVRETYEP